MRALATALEPVIEALRPLGALGRPGLWAEVGDGLGGPLAFQSELPVTPRSDRALERLVAVDGAPWTARPWLWRRTACACSARAAAAALTPSKAACARTARCMSDAKAAQLAWARSQ